MKKEQNLVLENSVFKAFEGKRDSWLDDIIQNIYSRCGQELNNKLLAIDEIDDIYLHTYADVSHVDKYKAKCQGFNETFAINFITEIDDQQKCAHIILVNKQLCEKSILSPNELIAIVLHELGHIMNHVEYVPTELHCIPVVNFMMNIEQKALYKKNVIHEYAADYFATSLGLGHYIVSTLEKSFTMDSLENTHSEFQSRIEKIQNKECCYGVYKKAILN